MSTSRSGGGSGRAASYVRTARVRNAQAMTELELRVTKMRGGIMAACAKAGMDEDTRRDMFERVAGKRSLTQMSAAELGKILDEINANKNPVAHSAKMVQNKVYALWMSAYWLGEIDHSDKKALDSFVKRQTGCDKFAWLKPHQAAKVIEALKAMCERAGVQWGLEEPSVAVSNALGHIILMHRIKTHVNISTDAQTAAREIPKLGKLWRMSLGKPV
jgi:phage gp16-like protein